MNLKNKARLSAFMIVSLTLLIFSCKDDEGTSEPHISSVAPESGAEGTMVTISGHDFSSTPAENSVKFNGTTATVSSSSNTEIVTTVPVGATTGKITVTVGDVTTTSPNDFEIVLCDGPELGISAGSASANGASTNYSMTLTNYGTEDINLAQWGYQNWASVNEVYDASDAGGGGAQLDSHGILSPGQSVTINSSAGVNPTAYSYYILTINVKGGQTVNECLTNNNVLAVPIIK